MTDLPTILDIQESAMLLPGRPQFWLSHQLAEFYQTRPQRVVEQLRRNPDRFPEDFWFELREDEKAVLVTQNARPNKINRGVMIGFTHAGALALSGVLKTKVADAVSVQIIRAVVAMEKQAIAEVEFLLEKTCDEIRHRRPILGRIALAAEHGWNFDMLNSSVSLSRPKLVLAIKDALKLGLIKKAPSGTPWQLEPKIINGNQPDLFGDA